MAASATVAAGLLLNYTTLFGVGDEPDSLPDEDYAGVSSLLPTDTVDYSQMDYPRELKYKPAWEMVVKTFFYILSIILALVGNIIVIVVVAKNARMHTATNFYIVNLAVADCLVVLTCSWTHLVDDLTPFWVLGSFFCTFNTFSQVLSLVASISTLAVIAGDRFFGIVFAMKAHFVERRARCTIALIWVFSLVVASPLLFFRRYQELQWRNMVEGWCDDVWPVEVWLDEETGKLMAYSPLRRLYYMTVCIVLFFIPCLIMTITYAVIIVTVWSAKVPGERISKDIKSQIRLRKRIIKMLVVIQAVFVLCWLPLIISLIYAEFVHQRDAMLHDWYIHFSYFACYLAYANSAINPFIYAGFNANFMKGFASLCGGAEARSRYNTMVSRVDSFQSSTHMTKV
ncbi:hypothetical protein RRG08_055486 [Elysia crispata]|uniref:G-protein coupled receptors family 1 profile domain-containing protein n=1 Tax=Elysia crispata TaxID=231223 RepID=A0AAE0XQH4_9GAST|nr:hypothetical protein RRG08_055486 [Elysia crispata]